LFLPGKVPDDPADRIHSAEVAARLLFRNTFEAAQPFAAGKVELID
jgi:hypothetical protein